MAAIPAAGGLHLFIFDQVQQAGQMAPGVAGPARRAGGKRRNMPGCRDDGRTGIRTYNSHESFAQNFRIPHPHIHPHAHPRTHVHPPQSDALGFAGNFCCSSAVKWDKA
jgi:hypothetical protein